MGNYSINGGIIGACNTPVNSKQVTSFTSSGCFNRTMPTGTAIVIAGGGGGSFGGAGAGGVLVVECHPFPASAVPVTVGAGGASTTANNCCKGSDGNNSVFGSSTPLTALKGMGGGGQNSGGPLSGINGGVNGSGGGAGGSNPAEGGKGTHPGSFGGCSPTYQGSPGGRAGPRSAGGGGACNQGQGMGGGGVCGTTNGGQGRDLTPFGVPTCLGDCGFFGGGGQAGSQGHPSNPLSIMRGLADKSSYLGKRTPGGGGTGQMGDHSVGIICISCHTGTVNKAGIANTGSGGGGARYPGSAPFPAAFSGGNGGSGIVIVIECVAGTKAKSGIYSMGAQYVHATRSAW